MGIISYSEAMRRHRTLRCRALALSLSSLAESRSRDNRRPNRGGLINSINYDKAAHPFSRRSFNCELFNFNGDDGTREISDTFASAAQRGASGRTRVPPPHRGE